MLAVRLRVIRSGSAEKRASKCSSAQHRVLCVFIVSVEIPVDARLFGDEYLHPRRHDRVELLRGILGQRIPLPTDHDGLVRRALHLVIMTERALIITHRDVEWHDAFLRYVPRVFPRISFRRWYEYGGWDERYVAFAIAEGDRIVASASVTRMDILLKGERIRGWQLGAVGTEPERRKSGLQREIMPRLLEHVPASELVFLFANHHVLDFYPRFGFRRVRDCMFEIETRTVEPSSSQLRVLDLESADDRALLQRVAAKAAPVTTDFGAEKYGQTVLWYWCNFFPNGVRYLPEEDVILVVEQGDDVLRIHDVLAEGELDLRSLLPRLITAPIHKLEFSFTPKRFWDETVSRPDYTDSPLFVRGPQTFPEGPFKFPMLAQT